MLDLASILRPVPLRGFLEGYYEKRPLFIRGGERKFEGLFDRAAFGAAISHKECRMKAAFVGRSGAHVEMQSVSPEQVPSLFEAGMTLCVPAIDRFDRKLEEVIERLRDDWFFNGDVQFNCYLSPDGKGFGTHFDDHSATILQIEGRKEWRFSAEPAMTFPVGNVVVPPAGDIRSPTTETPIPRPNEKAFLRCLLEPGDVLYLPSGTWHRARAIGHSLALTLRGPRRTFIDLLHATLQRLLYAKPDWRAPLPLVRSPEVVSRQASLLAELGNRLGELRKELSTIEPIELWRTWHCQAENRFARRGHPVVDRANVKPRERLLATGSRPLAFAVQPRNKEPEPNTSVYLYWEGREVQLAAAALPVLRTARTKKPFSATTVLQRDRTGALRWRDVKPILNCLVGMGVLQRVSKNGAR